MPHSQRHSRASAPRPAAPTTSIFLQVQGIQVVVAGLPSGEITARFTDLLASFIADTSAAATPLSPRVRIEVQPWPEGPGWLVTSGGSLDERRVSDPASLLSYVEWLVVSQAVAASAGCVAFHAAALTRADETVMLLANSGAGKTTLTLGLMARGWAPLTDDITLVDVETLAITPFPRPFHPDPATEALLSDSSLLTPRGRLPGYASPVNWAPGGHPPTRLFLIQRCASCPSSRFPVLQAEAAGVLLAQAIENERTPSQLAQIAARLAGAARGCYRLTNGHLDGALNLIESASAR